MNKTMCGFIGGLLIVNTIILVIGTMINHMDGDITLGQQLKAQGLTTLIYSMLIGGVLLVRYCVS